MAGKKPYRRLNARSARKAKEKFLAAYAKTGNATATQEITGISRFKHVHWLKSSDEYRKAFEQAEDAATELLEVEARRRAVEGRDDPVYYNGHQIGTVKKYSDLLLIFLLKAKRPDVYRERWDTRINNNLAIQTAVKVVHEYHETPPTLDVTALETTPNKALMVASTPPPQPATILTEQKVGAGPTTHTMPLPANYLPAGTGTGTGTPSSVDTRYPTPTQPLPDPSDTTPDTSEDEPSS